MNGSAAPTTARCRGAVCGRSERLHGPAERDPRRMRSDEPTGL